MRGLECRNGGVDVRETRRTQVPHARLFEGGCCSRTPQTSRSLSFVDSADMLTASGGVHAQVVSSIVQAVSAGVIVVLTIVIAVITSRYVHWTRKLFEATKDLAEQAVGQGVATREMAAAMTRTAEATTRQARLMHLERYAEALHRVLSNAEELLPGFRLGDGRAIQLGVLRDFAVLIAVEAENVPDPARLYLRGAGNYARELIEAAQRANGINERDLHLGVVKLAVQVAADLGIVLRGDEPPAWPLPEGDDVLPWVREESQKLGAP